MRADLIAARSSLATAGSSGVATADVPKIVIGDTERTTAVVYDRGRPLRRAAPPRPATPIATATETKSETGCVPCVARPNGIRGLE